ncbi:MAG: GTP cyclohydrolase II [Rhodospirillaceae bacterium]|nr:GTP cyclohydrolase II [Rhodospirillaceae bacterium]
MTRPFPEKSVQPPAAAPAELLEGVERALAEVRRGSALVVLGAGEAALIRAAETVDTWPLSFFARPGVGPMDLVVTGKRAAILGLCESGTRAVKLDSVEDWTAERIEPLINPEAQGPIPPPGVKANPTPVGSVADAAIRLMKIARLLPAAVVAPITAEDAAAWAKANGRWCVTVQAIDSYERMQAEDLRVVSEARVPLADAENTRIVSFRSRDGSAEHLAIVIGAIDAAKPVLARLHSECFTGDLLGSLRCDCGEQLRGAIQAIAQEGAGVLLYLAQEGRGIGLVNKLRAYRLQDFGFDTLDANEQLGFDDDERVYLPAVQMLRQLGIGKVRLLTNNPAKVGALARHGIEVTERVSHVFPSNEHNRSYLLTKAKRGGHLF